MAVRQQSRCVGQRRFLPVGRVLLLHVEHLPLVLLRDWSPSVVSGILGTTGGRPSVRPFLSLLYLVLRIIRLLGSFFK